MNRTVLRPVLLAACAVLWPMVAPLHLHSQQLSVSMKDVDFRGLPRVTFSACVQKNNALVLGLDSSRFTLTENGILQTLKIRCPDPTRFNSVALVIDNSGSISNALVKIREAAGIMVDSLGTADECAVITFGRTITVQQDFTTDRLLLAAALTRLTANGGTPMFDASYLAVQMLAARPGNRHAVILTDGEDNMSSATIEDVIALARANGIKLYTIGFGIAFDIQKIMTRMAVETGGSPFFVERPSELNAVYERIAREITEKCCVAEYESTSCADTLRDLVLTVSDSGLTATDRQIFPSPARAARTVLSVDVPDELSPLATGMGFVTMTPAPSPALELSLSFTLTFDENLVDIAPPLPFTLGTVAQNQIVLIERVAPGEVRFTFNRIKPALATGRLVGFPLQARLADSSRRVPFAIRLDNIALAGCPTEFSMIPDSTTVCQCRRLLSVALALPAVVRGDERFSVPVAIQGGLERSIGIIGAVELRIPADAQGLEFEEGTLFPAGSLRWNRSAPDAISITLPEAFPPLDTAGILGTISFSLPAATAAQSLSCAVTRAEAWQRCCPAAGPLDTMVILVDGICERIVSPTGAPALSAAPNPISAGRGAATVSARIPPAFADSRFTLLVADVRGEVVATLFDRILPAGITTASLDASRIPAGRYTLVLWSADTAATRNIIVVR